MTPLFEYCICRQSEYHITGELTFIDMSQQVGECGEILHT